MRLVAVGALCLAIAGTSVRVRAADIQKAGKLEIPANASVVAICTDPVVQNVLGDALRVARHSPPAEPTESVTLTVTINQQLLAPGVSLNQLFPGDPSMVELLKAAGAEPPPLGDTGNAPSADPFETQARAHALNPLDPMTENYKNYQAMRNQMSGANAPTPYDSIPKNELYDTVIVARASIEGSLDQLKVVAVVHSGDDPRKAKILVAEEIANAVLH
ncbi:MAG: hypothetical protein Q7S58_13920 [Candidatus Binatus sp.]|uniref:hypothetical protein n=1 Tax=Candidatus Binatus sp. TaxID=2811406 RepID=UPI00271BFB7C|nr:hypothetical protein [Candidatus Binatus sp.]MDO8433497.1 hypothetical protein [Candidatus Binatus sp.]